MADVKLQKKKKPIISENVEFYLKWITSIASGEFGDLIRTLFAEYGISKDLKNDVAVLKKRHIELMRSAKTINISEMQSAIETFIDREQTLEAINKVVPELLLWHVFYPKDVSFVQLLARSLDKVNKLDGEEICLQQVLHMRKDDDYTCSLLADCMLRQKKFSAALQQYLLINVSGDSTLQQQQEIMVATCKLGMLLQEELRHLPASQDVAVVAKKGSIESYLAKCGGKVQLEFGFGEEDRKAINDIFANNAAALKKVNEFFQKFAKEAKVEVKAIQLNGAH